MADNEKAEDQGKAPPKINMDMLGGESASEPDQAGREQASAPESKMPPRLRIMRPKAAAPDETSTDEAAPDKPGKKSTTRIDIESAESAPKKHIPLQGIKRSSPKSDTSRVDLPDTQASDKDAEEIKPPEKTVSKDTTEDDLSETAALSEVDEEALERAIQETYQAAKESTQRVSLDDSESQAPPKKFSEEREKDQTARLDQASLEERDEIESEKKKTMPIRPDTEADDGETARPPTTIKIKKPPLDDRPTGTTIPIPDLEESRKSETARIDLPKGVASAAPPTQRKTIRIKRPDGTAVTRPVMSVSRPPKGERPAGAADEKAEAEREEESTAVCVLALIATMAALILVYVLAATLVPGLPFPGRLV